MDPNKKAEAEMILLYLKNCEELKEEKINILLRALSKSKVTEIS